MGALNLNMLNTWVEAFTNSIQYQTWRSWPTVLWWRTLCAIYSGMLSFLTHEPRCAILGHKKKEIFKRINVWSFCSIYVNYETDEKISCWIGIQCVQTGCLIVSSCGLHAEQYQCLSSSLSTLPKLPEGWFHICFVNKMAISAREQTDSSTSSWNILINMLKIFIEIDIWDPKILLSRVFKCFWPFL